MQEHEKEVKHSGGATEELIRNTLPTARARQSQKSMNGAQLANHWQHIPLAIEAVALGYNMQAKNVPEAQQYNYNIRSFSCRYLSSPLSHLISDVMLVFVNVGRVLAHCLRDKFAFDVDLNTIKSKKV